jgi:hypothetical protein
MDRVNKIQAFLCRRKLFVARSVCCPTLLAKPLRIVVWCGMLKWITQPLPRWLTAPLIPLAAFYAFVFTLAIEGEEELLDIAIGLPRHPVFWLKILFPCTAIMLVAGLIPGLKRSLLKSRLFEWWMLCLLYVILCVFSAPLGRSTLEHMGRGLSPTVLR